MIIIWRGWGILGFLIPVAIALLLGALINHIGIALLIGAVVNFYVGYKLNNMPGKVYVDPETGNNVEFKKSHSLFWIPMQYISIIWVIIAIFLIIAGK